MEIKNLIKNFKLEKDVEDLLLNCKKVTFASSLDELTNISVANVDSTGWHKVTYDVEGQGPITEAVVCRVKNGIAANYLDPYMRRRDPDSLLIGDDLPTDKVKYSDLYNAPFKDFRKQTLDWLKSQELIAFVFKSGQLDINLNTLAVVPANAGFFAFALGLIQGIIDIKSITGTFPIKCTLFAAPPFRHSHFGGKQLVVHNRLNNDKYEIFSYNLYPGPSAKKGIYGALIHFGEQEGWITTHSAIVQVVTPYDNKVTIMHEGASGGGKSEMLENLHREQDGTLLFAQSTITDEKIHIVIPRGCKLRPVTDDMAICHSSLQKHTGKLGALDAEAGWFIRVDHILNYGTDPDIESRSIHPSTPLLFLNIDVQPNSTALLWDHIHDEPGKPCPNPRFILPRNCIPGVVNKPVYVDIRSFGVRTPPCTKSAPDIGILGIFHVLPPSLAWIWRLVSPRGYNNPSIINKKGQLESEGVGSYWPFATGLKVKQANILLDQIVDTNKVHYTICPNQHIGAWKVGFMPQWIMREYVARHGGIKFIENEIGPSRCPILGYALNKLIVEGQSFQKGFLRVEFQSEVGIEAYDEAAKKLTEFFKSELKQFYTKDLSPLGRQIIDCCLDDGSVENYHKLISSEPIIFED